VGRTIGRDCSATGFPTVGLDGSPVDDAILYFCIPFLSSPLFGRQLVSHESMLCLDVPDSGRQCFRSSHRNRGCPKCGEPCGELPHTSNQRRALIWQFQGFDAVIRGWSSHWTLFERHLAPSFIFLHTVPSIPEHSSQWTPKPPEVIHSL
jgi:hypothetical protein